MNIYDVSKKAGVSIATVSRVLNGNANVTEATRKKVMKAIEELDYTPNIFARGLGLNTMNTIGILCNDCSDTYIANAVYYLQQELSLVKYDSILCCTGNKPEDMRNSMNLLLSKRVDAIILTGSQYVLNAPEDHDNSYIRNAAKDVPVFLVNGTMKGDNIYSVLCDDAKAIHDVTTDLIEAGKRHIVYLYSSTSLSGMNKLSGYLKALDEHGIPNYIEYTHLCEKDIYAARDYLQSLKDDHKPVDAVICSEDYLAVGAMKFAAENKISIPEQIEIVGYNNSVLADCTTPELSSIDNHVQKVCKLAVNNLMRVLSNEKPEAEQYIQANLQRRKSTTI